VPVDAVGLAQVVLVAVGLAELDFPLVAFEKVAVEVYEKSTAVAQARLKVTP
jgi:hypothetical protein